jgi:hypothetical protein
MSEQSTAEKRKQRTITLTGRPPVKIYEDEWPVIATASDRPGSFVNGTPVPDYETDSLSLRVRQHEDGRVLVYGVLDAATAWTGSRDWRGGVLLERGQDIAAAILAVARDGGLQDLAAECVADLPAEEI